MYIHDLKNADGARTSKKRLGRGIGSGIGKTSGKGHKGQNARSGGGVRPGFEGGQLPLFQRLPKIGFNSHSHKFYAIVNIEKLNCFEDGAVVDAESLIAAGLIKEVLDGVKVLGQGELNKKLTVKVNKISKSAQAAIEAAGGSVEVI